MSPRIFVVSSDNDRLSSLLGLLSGAGYRASGASTFAQAKEILGMRSPDLVIADERLGPFNGLHVIVLGRAHRPDMKGIVTSNCKDCGLEADAKRLNVACLVEPATPAEWLLSISNTLEDGIGSSSRTVVH